jgi:hypothetical protein
MRMKQQDLLEALEEIRRRLRRCLIDYSFPLNLRLELEDLAFIAECCLREGRDDDAS